MIFGSCHFLCHQFTQRDESYQIITDVDALVAFSAAFIRRTDIWDMAMEIVNHDLIYE